MFTPGSFTTENVRSAVDDFFMMENVNWLDFSDDIEYMLEDATNSAIGSVTDTAIHDRVHMAEDDDDAELAALEILEDVTDLIVQDIGSATANGDVHDWADRETPVYDSDVTEFYVENMSECDDALGNMGYSFDEYSLMELMRYAVSGALSDRAYAEVSDLHHNADVGLLDHLRETFSL